MIQSPNSEQGRDTNGDLGSLQIQIKKLKLERFSSPLLTKDKKVKAGRTKEGVGVHFRRPVNLDEIMQYYWNQSFEQNKFRLDHILILRTSVSFKDQINK